MTIVGARPQFIKAAAVSRAVRGQRAAGRPVIEESIVHTGQHYDHGMSQAFFDDLGIPAPRHNLAINGGGHGQMTGRMLERLEEIMLADQPDWVLVYGDTNSTLAGALAAAKLNIPVAHVEAGLRSFNRRMPEEVNRVMADHVSTLLLCPTRTAVDHLSREGLTRGVHLVGDVMYDIAMHARGTAAAQSTIMRDLGLTPRGFILATCHRAENTDDPQRLAGILAGLGTLAGALPVILPLHPRTAGIIAKRGLATPTGVRAIPPLGFMDMVMLESQAGLIATDSGGVQKEAYFYQTPCITMRDETEWTETVDSGWNRLVGADPVRIASGGRAAMAAQLPWDPTLYGDGHAAEKVVEHILAAR